MKLKRSFLVHQDGEQKLLVPTGEAGFSGLVRCNASAGLIVSCLEHETTEAEILARMTAEWDIPAETAKRDLERILGELRQIGAIDE